MHKEIRENLEFKKKLSPRIYTVYNLYIVKEVVFWYDAKGWLCLQYKEHEL